ncbi:hypothetical protein KUV85_12330 [Nocardioides panacisoli]|uniref:hypothetical protein n=1 Tax=Nocardioides panacisoli TaxID=627624 RepID=UPI001C63B6FF|nr:hypothetical protein [Nocardioides panacisoli]QYJ03119.1 hypothetical protein KUV85_12330 [Nocardioides panacisoli]
MRQPRPTGTVFLILALVFVTVGLAGEAGEAVTWLVLAGVFALIGILKLRRSPDN